MEAGTMSYMRCIAAFVVVTAPLLARDKPEVRDWQEGTVRSVELTRGTAWRLAEVDLEIVTDKITYEMMLAHIGRKADLIPFVGIVTVGQRQKHTHLDVKAGTVVKFAVSAQHGWLIDEQGVERKLVVKSARAIPGMPK